MHRGRSRETQKQNPDAWLGNILYACLHPRFPLTRASASGNQPCADSDCIPLSRPSSTIKATSLCSRVLWKYSWFQAVMNGHSSIATRSSDQRHCHMACGLTTSFLPLPWTCEAVPFLYDPCMHYRAWVEALDSRDTVQSKTHTLHDAPRLHLAGLIRLTTVHTLCMLPDVLFAREDASWLGTQPGSLAQLMMPCRADLWLLKDPGHNGNSK